jgi:hypothetical protein
MKDENFTIIKFKDLLSRKKEEYSEDKVLEKEKEQLRKDDTKGGNRKWKLKRRKRSGKNRTLQM